jgi:hypothetical protein
MLTSRRQLYGVVTSLHRRPGRASAGHPPRRDAYPPFGARRWPPDPVTRMPSARHAHKQRTVVWGREAASRVRPGSDTTRSRPNRHGTTLHGLLSKIARKTLPLSLRAWAAKRTKVGEGLVPGSQRHSECSPDRRPGTGPAPAATARFHPGRHRTTLHGLLSALREVTWPLRHGPRPGSDALGPAPATTARRCMGSCPRFAKSTQAPRHGPRGCWPAA